MNHTEMIPIGKIKTRVEFKTLFKVYPEVVARIAGDMRKTGYDSSFPVFLCEVPEAETFLLDGHMRLEAAERAGIREIPFERKTFDSLEEALDYAIHVQRDRRNITDAELFQQILLVDKRWKRGRTGETVKGKSASRTASRLGTSTRKVEAARQVKKYASPDQVKEIQAGKRTINSVLTEVREKQRGSNAQPKDPEYENLAVRIMLLTTEFFPDLESISDSKSEAWEKALVQFLFQNLKKMGLSA